MCAEFRRKSIRLDPGAYLGRRLYFLTFCFYERKPIASNPRIAAWLIQRLRHHSFGAGFLVHAYCLMPDHAHVLALGATNESDLRAFVDRFKQDTGFAFASRTSRQLWQFKYYDHIVRSEDAARRVAAYIWMNPVRKKLCANAQDYKFSGSFTDFGTSMFRRTDVEPWTPPWKSKSSR
jgi:REP-associated tyrosine transposase